MEASGGNSGAFTRSIPIAVPPGRRGLDPSLSLSYNSSTGNGFVGAGWSLPIAHIVRNSKYGVDYNRNTMANAFVAVFPVNLGVSAPLRYG